jgi:hypothetical protein
LLSMTDSFVSEGWTKKSNFTKEGKDKIQPSVRIEVCRSHTMRLMKSGIKDYSQWFPQKQSDISNALSKDNNQEGEELTHILQTFVPSQLPKYFRIVPLPNGIVCWLTLLLQKLPAKE